MFYNDLIFINMNEPLFPELKTALSIMKRQNEVIREAVLKKTASCMKLIVCTGKRTDDSFNLKSFNKDMLKKMRQI